MTEEEKKMLKIFSEEVKKEQEEYEQVNEYTKFIYNVHQIILNIIDKQQKEIEELKEEIEIYKETENDYEHELARKDEEIEELKDKNKTLESLLQGNLYEMYLYYKELAGKYQANCISKDEIKNKIKELEEKYSEHSEVRIGKCIEFLDELLEE